MAHDKQFAEFDRQMEEFRRQRSEMLDRQARESAMRYEAEEAGDA